MSRLLPFVFILIAIALFFGYVRPTWEGSIAESKAQIQSYDSALSAAARFSDNEAKLEEERNSIPADELARLTAFLPDSVDNVQLILDLNALASRSGVTLSNFTTAEAPNGSAAANDSSNDGSAPSPLTDSLTLSVSATGSYDSYRAFLAGIEQSLRPLDVTALSVTDSDTGVYTYQTTLTFYWLH